MTGQKKIRRPRKPTAQRLRNRALAFLSSRDATRVHLKEVLMRRASRDARFHQMDEGEVEKSVDELLDSLEETGLLDDARVAPARARFEARRALSDRRIRMKLESHGIEGDLLDKAMCVASEEESEEIRAFRYARRRRIGPYGGEISDTKERNRQMASLARAGFPIDTIRKVVMCPAEDVPEEVPA